MNALSAPHSKGEDQFLDKKNIAEEGAAGGDSGRRERGGDTTWILQREAGGSDVRVKCSGEGAFTITVLRDEEGGANGLNPSAGSEGGCVDSDGEGEFLWDVQACGSGSDSRQLRQGTQNTCSQASMDATVQRSTEEDKVDGSSDNGRVEQGALPAQKGQKPPPAFLPTGCAFHPRCPDAFKECRSELPPLYPIGSQQHTAACLLYKDTEKAGQA